MRPESVSLKTNPPNESIEERMHSTPLALRSNAERLWPLILFLVFWLFLLRYSWMQYTHYALTKDFALYHQAWYEIAQGNLNPREFVQGGLYYQNHLELLMWALAPLYWIWPHSFWLLALQDTGIVGSGFVAWLWISTSIKKSSLSLSGKRFLSVIGLALLFVNPWVIRSATFDFHFQDIAGFFLVAAAWQFKQNRNSWAFFWAILVALTGNVSMTYLAALGISIIIVDRGRRPRGWLTAFIGLSGFLISQHLGVGLGVNIGPASSSAAPAPTAHSLIFNLATHPIKMLSSIWSARQNSYANLAPDGILGLANMWSFPIVGLLILENSLPGAPRFTNPGFQSFPFYGFMVIGTMSVLIKIFQKKSWIGTTLGGLVIVNVAGWALAWTPTMVPAAFTDHITHQGEKTLAWIQKHIPPHAEVVASQGILGRFASRSFITPFVNNYVRVKSKPVVFIVSPYQGINLSNTATELSRIAYLSHLSGCRQLIHQGGIWAFEWTPTPGTTSLIFPNANMIPAWGLNTKVGTPVLQGPIQNWHMATTSTTPGYVVDQAYWRLPNGHYRIMVRIAESGPANLEVWNATAGLLLRRFFIPETNGIQNTTFAFDVQHQYPLNHYQGLGPFTINPPKGSSPYDNIELRVWTPGHEIVNVYTLQIQKLKSYP